MSAIEFIIPIWVKVELAEGVDAELYQKELEATARERVYSCAWNAVAGTMANMHNCDRIVSWSCRLDEQ